MATYGWDDIDLLMVDGYDVAVMEAFEIEIPFSEAVTDAWHPVGATTGTVSDTGTRRPSGNVMMRMPANDETDGANDAFYGGFITDGVWMVGVEGNALGRNVEAAVVHSIKFMKEPGPEAVTKLMVELVVSGDVHEMPLVMARTTVTADGNTEGASLDGAASTANGGWAMVQVANADYDGGDGIGVTLQHSADDAVWADLVTFTEITTARGAELSAVAKGTTVNRYLSAAYDFTGTPGGSATADVLVAFRRRAA